MIYTIVYLSLLAILILCCWIFIYIENETVELTLFALSVIVALALLWLTMGLIADPYYDPDKDEIALKLLKSGNCSATTGLSPVFSKIVTIYDTPDPKQQSEHNLLLRGNFPKTFDYAEQKSKPVQRIQEILKDSSKEN